MSKSNIQLPGPVLSGDRFMAAMEASPSSDSGGDRASGVSLRERVEKLERVASLARAFQDDSTLETTASIDLSVALGKALSALEADDE